MLDITNLEKALDTLKISYAKLQENTDNSIKEMLEDSCVKRFEFTLELSWKIMKKYLKLQYGKSEQELTKNNIFRFMQGFEMIKSWETWKYYFDKRNETSHEYNFDKSREIITILPDFIVNCDFLIINLKKALNLDLE